MHMAAVIKHFNISREDVERELEASKISTLAQPETYNVKANETDKEGRELFNPDIIYTFDNEIINAYYRRENPVVPEAGTYKTYESYEEYRQANP